MDNQTHEWTKYSRIDTRGWDAEGGLNSKAAETKHTEEEYMK